MKPTKYYTASERDIFIDAYGSGLVKFSHYYNGLFTHEGKYRDGSKTLCYTRLNGNTRPDLLISAEEYLAVSELNPDQAVVINAIGSMVARFGAT